MDRSHLSRLQNDVVNELTSMGFHPQEEMILSCSGYRLENKGLVHGEKVGIEVDGPFHFTPV
jgi:Fe2+ transport system protein FeoA